MRHRVTGENHSVRVLTHFILWRLRLARAETQTSEAERNRLAKYAAGKRRLVEVGVWHAVTTTLLRRVMAPDGVLYAVDPFPAGRLGTSLQQIIARHEVRRIDTGTVEWVRLTGAEAGRSHARKQDPLVDFVFLDGDHSYEGLEGDWLAWSPLIAPAGIVAVHDSRSSADRCIEGAGSLRYTRDVILKDPRFRAFDAVDTLTVLQRRSV